MIIEQERMKKASLIPKRRDQESDPDSLIADSATTNISSTEHNHKFAPDPNGCDTCSLAWSMFFDAVLANYPDLEIHFEVALAVCAVLGLPKPWRPVTIIYEGPS